MTIQSKTQVSIDSTFSHILPVSHHEQPIPLVKIYTCGGLRIEVLQQPAETSTHACYCLPPSLNPPSRGAAPAQTMLKMLVSTSKRYRSMDWFREYWYQEGDGMIGRIDNIASFLRGLLCPLYVQGEQRDSYRRKLLSYTYSSHNNGNGYALDAYPLIWVDVDALDWNVQQACRMERFGDDSFLFWERAYHLASQGLYLPEELYSDWAESRRTSVSGSLRQSVHALARLYLVRYGEQGQAEVIRLLRDYLVQFPTDEDALRLLIELLGQMERFHEAKQMFLRTKSMIEKEGNTLDMRTLEVWEYLQTKQIYRQRLGGRFLLHNALPSEPKNHVPVFPQLSEAITAGIVRAMEVLEQKKLEASEHGSNDL